MARRIEKFILRGEFTNEISGAVTGQIWLAGVKRPIRVKLEGNFLRDIAGTSVHFENPHPEAFPMGERRVARIQRGRVGDMTASKKARVPAVTDREFLQLLEMKKPIPSVLANTLYLEWFSPTDGRVLIEATNFQIRVSEPMWVMSEKEEANQLRRNLEAHNSFLSELTGQPTFDPAYDDFERPAVEDFEDIEQSEGYFGNGSMDEGEGGVAEPNFAPDSDDSEDEFTWEQTLQETDRQVDAYQKAIERYADHPEKERMIAEEMGWETPVEFASEPSDFEFPDTEAETDFGRHHPLTKRVMDLTLRLQGDAERVGVLGRIGDAEDTGPVLRMITSTMQLGAKLAGALDGMAHGVDPEPGFVVALLKRSMPFMNDALSACEAVKVACASCILPIGWVEEAIDELFSVRKEVLDVMTDLRRVR